MALDIGIRYLSILLFETYWEKPISKYPKSKTVTPLINNGCFSEGKAILYFKTHGFAVSQPTVFRGYRAQFGSYARNKTLAVGRAGDIFGNDPLPPCHLRKVRSPRGGPDVVGDRALYAPQELRL
jgi:hypothetical protein